MSQGERVQQERPEVISSYRGSLKAAKVPPTFGSPGKRKRRRSFDELEIQQIAEATNYDKDEEIIDPVELVREFKRHPQFSDELRKLTEVTIDDGLAPNERADLGRPRMPGRWDLLYIAFVASRDPAPFSFWKRWRSSPIWAECGFEHRPHYNTIEKHFVELEERLDGFRHVKQLLVQHAKRHCPLVGVFNFYDFTGWQSHARIHHAPIEQCPECQKEKAEAQKAGKKWRAPGRTLKRAEASDFESERQKEADTEEHETRGRPRSALKAVGLDESGNQLFLDDKNHVHFTRDSESGVRKYEGKGSWLGGLGGGFVDVLFGAGLAFDAFRADEAEFDHYPELYEDLVASIGEDPAAVSIDKGNAVRDLFEFNTRRGVGTAAPRRIYKNRRTGTDWRSENFDEHGHPRCQNCNGEGVMDQPSLGWFRDRQGDPRLRFRCATPYNDGCKKSQSIPCSEEWLLLQPLAITHPLFQTMRYLHNNLERIWGHYRSRYAYAGKDVTGRLKRPGVSPQRLRGQAALVIDWFRILLRHGWLGSWRTQNPNQPVGVSATKLVLNMERVRRARGLDVPYGKRWEKLKERMKKRRHKPYTHGASPPGGAPPAKPPAPPPPKADGAKIWLPPPNLGRKRD